jgi:hypothetical protein
MKRYTGALTALLTCLLLTVAARFAWAQWLLAAVTANGVYDGQQVRVRVSDADTFKEFVVTMTPRPKAVSPFLSTSLGLIAGDKWVAQVPVSERRENGMVTFTFRVAPEAVAQSYFEIHASAYEPVTSGGRPSPFATAMLGTQKVAQTMGGTVFRLNLKDFTHAPTLEALPSAPTEGASSPQR